MTSSPQDVPFFELAMLHEEILDDLDVAWKSITRANAFIGGEIVETFEQRFADYQGAAHCVGVANGTDALEMILAGLDVGPGDDVIVPTNTFLATAEAVVNVGARPIFVDIDPDTLLITADAIQAAITPTTAAVMVVHLYGQMAAMDEIMPVCDAAGIAVVEDAAQAHGAEWKGQRAGTFGAAAGFSFYPGKNLGAFGDGGAVVTNDAELAARVRSIANHGRSTTDHYLHHVVGRNSRLDGLQGAVLNRKLDELDRWNGMRRANHATYVANLPAGAQPVAVRDDAVAVHHLEVVQVDDRVAVRDALAAAGIGSSIHYPVACHNQPAFAGSGSFSLPIAETSTERIISLPMFPHLNTAQVERVCAELTKIVG